LEARVRGFHPALANVRIERRWGGPIAFRQGWAPVLMRDPAAPNVVVTGAYAGHGVALSHRIGDVAAAAVAEGGALPAWGALAEG
jgi:glycine/D-amino acid oxidase-like deaminating enzyme